MSFQTYLSDIRGLFSPSSSEYSYRTPFENYLREIFPESEGYRIKHEDKTGDGNKPDFMVAKKNGDTVIPLLYIEVKDIGKNLDTIEKSNQATRYFGYDNLIIADYLEFRFYRYGQAYEAPIVLAESDRKNWNITPRNPDAATMLERRMRDFITTGKERIKSASHLAKIMGGKAQRVRDNLREMMLDESRFEDIWKLYRTFKSEILHDLSTHDFADLYAQTLVYGLFVARYHDKTPETFSRIEARDLVPKSNPLLRRFFDHIAGEGYEKRLEYIVDELCEVFAHADVHALMHGVYQRETHDPVIHFYEDFLGEYDSDLRMARGVFYTPAPVVKFIIRAVDDVLKSHFGLAKGLADTSKIQIEREIQKYDKKGERKTETIETHRVQILDPATGTGTFLDEVVRHIHSKMKGQEGMWPSYVNQDLLPRLHGFELMMASYTIAHLKLGLTLAETGVEDLEKRLQIYLTNSLEEAKTKKEDQGTLFGLLESITDEARQADEVKRDKPVMIVVGNPPYSGISTNVGEWITKKIEDYKYVDGVHFGEKKHWLQDDYVKFFRLGESLIEKNGEGILAYITNHGYLDNPTFRGMRWHLLKTFDHIYIVDLHGNSKKKETTPDGGKDENVFDIQQGTAIFIGVKNGKKKSGELAKISHIDQYGRRQEKYDWLENNSLKLAKELTPANPYYFFVPKNTNGQEEYESGFGVNEIFPMNVTGVVTAIDKLAIHYTAKEATELAHKILNSTNPYIEFGIKDQRKHTKEARITELRESFENATPIKIAYRPFDIRYMYYTNKTECWINSPRYEMMKNMLLGNNIGLILNKVHRCENYRHAIMTTTITDFHITETANANPYIFPLYLYSDSENLEGTTKTPNLDATIWAKINESVGRETTPEEVLDYIYAVLHSPNYREKYKEFLKIDFPRVPYPRDRASFEALVKLGGELRGLHLLESPKVVEYITTFPVAGTGEVEKVTVRHCEERSNPETPGSPRSARDDGVLDVYINTTQYFGEVPEVAWNFYIGGYQPAQKWLKDRKGRVLTWEDILHYQSMIVALTETARVMGEVDGVLEV